MSAFKKHRENISADDIGNSCIVFLGNERYHARILLWDDICTYFSVCKKSNIISIALLIFSIVAILNVGNFNMNYRFIYYGIPCLAFFWSAILANDISIKPLVFIGNASYSIYLSHFIVVSFICKEFSKHLTVKSPVDVFFFYLLTVFISVFIGILTYLLVEKPMTRFFSIYIK